MRGMNRLNYTAKTFNIERSFFSYQGEYWVPIPIGAAQIALQWTPWSRERKENPLPVFCFRIGVEAMHVSTIYSEVSRCYLAKE